MKNAEIRPKKQKKSTKKLDKPTSSHYKRYRKMYAVIVLTIIVFLVFNLFFQMKKLTLLAAGLIAAVTPITAETGEKTSDADILKEQASKARKIDATVNTTEVDVNTTIAPEFSGDGDPTPKTEPQKKVYKYFWNKTKWTYATMNALKPLEIKSYLAKAGVDITTRADFMDAYSYFKDLKVAKHTQETIANFEATVSN